MVSGCEVATEEILQTKQIQKPPPPPRPPVPVEVPNDEILKIPEKWPQPIGGLSALSAKIKYPEIARKAGIEGSVYVRFVVDEQGNVRNAQVEKGIGAGCDTEALRVVRSLRFRPGQKDGKPVNVQMTLPVQFKLSAEG